MSKEFLVVLVDDNAHEAILDEERKELEAVGLAAPQVTYIMQTLKEAGLAVETDATTLTEARDSILAACGHGKEK